MSIDWRIDLKSKVNSLLKSVLGYELRKAYNFLNDLSYSQIEREIYNKCQSRTMTTLNSISNLISATEYLSASKIQGAYVECGVWRGGSAMAYCLATLQKGLINRELYLYDTYQGYLSISKKDYEIQNGKSPTELFKRDENYLCSADLNDVKNGLQSTGYPIDMIHYIVGDVLETIPATIPSSIALLRLDTDYYDSTLHELENLFSLVSPGGVVIIDDYDYWNGSRQATDIFFGRLEDKFLLTRMESGRILIKQSR